MTSEKKVTMKAKFLKTDQEKIKIGVMLLQLKV
jgi:hypothetical protein